MIGPRIIPALNVSATTLYVWYPALWSLDDEEQHISNRSDPKRTHTNTHNTHSHIPSPIPTAHTSALRAIAHTLSCSLTTAARNHKTNFETEKRKEYSKHHHRHQHWSSLNTTCEGSAIILHSERDKVSTHYRICLGKGLAQFWSLASKL